MAGEAVELATSTRSSFASATSRALRCLATETAALEAIAASEVPGPRLLGVAMGGPAAPGVFALVMTRVPGTSRSSVEPSTARLRALGEAVAIVHAAPVPTSPHLPLRRRPIEPVDFDAARRSEPARPLLVEAESVLRRIPMPDHRAGVRPRRLLARQHHVGRRSTDGHHRLGVCGHRPSGHRPRHATLRRRAGGRTVRRRRRARRLRIGHRTTRPPTSPTGTSPRP